MEFRVLGPLEIELDGDRLALFDSRKHRVLAALLLDAGRVVSLSRLVEAVWDGDPPASAAKAVRNSVSTLRRWLNELSGLGERITTEPAGYLLRVQDDEVDLHRFTRLASQGQRLASAGEFGPAVTHLRAALELWRGDALAGVSGRAIATAAARLDDSRLAVQEELLACELAVGRHREILDELHALVAAQPLRERPRAQLMLALYRSGRRSEALAAYRDARQTLVRELGVEPGAELAELHQDILTDDPRLAGPVTTPHRRYDEPTPTGPDVDRSPTDGPLPARVISAQVRGITEVVGRDAELLALAQGFADGNRCQRPVLRVLTGLGGVGKTTLARAYAERYQQTYDLIWWVHAEDRDAVAGQFRALLEILAPRDIDHIHDSVQAVQALLANRDKPWLLILDNVVDASDLLGVMPAAGLGHVLVTSRSGTWFDRQAVIVVKPLTEKDAVRLVTSLSGDPDQATATVLARELGGLPLALAQAGCYVAHNAIDLGGYLTLYRRRRADMHLEGRVPDYADTVSTTWRLTSDVLPRPSRVLLDLIAWYAPDAIPFDLLFNTEAAGLHLEPRIDGLVRPLLADELHRHRATTDLLLSGLLSLGDNAGAVSVHRLVQAVTADHLTAASESGVWIETAAVLLRAACPRPAAAMASMAAWRRLQTHVGAMVEHLDSDHPLALGLRDVRAGWTGEMGDSAQARELYAALAEDAERALGREHPETLAARARCAYWTGETGDSVRARKLYAALAEDYTLLLGPEHRDTLIVRNYLADWTGEAGDIARARELCGEVVADMAKVLGFDDPDTLLARTYLAYWTGEAGDAATARDMCSAVVEDRKRVLGADHPSVVSARVNLARWTARSGAVARAREMSAGIVEELSWALEFDDRDTRIARLFLAYWTEEAIDSPIGRELYAMLVADGELVSDPHQRNIQIRRAVMDAWAKKRLRQDANS